MNDSSARRLVHNTGLSWVLNIVLRAAGTVVFVAIGRWGSIEQAGIFSLALGYLAILTTLFTGVDDILVRESASQPRDVFRLLMTYGVIRFCLSITVWLILLLLLRLLNLYSVDELTILMIIAASAVADTFGAIGQAVLHAHGHFAAPLAATATGSFVRVVGALIVLATQQELVTVAWVWPLGSFVTAAAMYRAVTRHLHRADSGVRVRFDVRLARHLMRLIPAFSATSVLAGLEYQLDVVLLSVMLSNQDVAWYSAAVTIMLIVLTVSQAYRMAFFPLIVRAQTERPSAVKGLVGRSLVIMGGLASIVALGITLLAPWLIELLYAGRFSETVPILQVLIWNTIFFFLNVPLVRFMLAVGRQSTVWRTLLVSLIVNVIANFALIPRLGVIGPAYARLLSSGLFCGLMAWQVFRRFKQYKPAPQFDY